MSTNYPSATGPGSDLTEEQVSRARELWDAGGNMRTIAKEIGCGIYDLSPWIFRDQVLAIKHVEEARKHASGHSPNNCPPGTGLVCDYAEILKTMPLHGHDDLEAVT